MNVTVYCGAAFGDDPDYEKTARELGAWIVDRGHRLVWGGGATGLMGAVSLTVLKAGGEATGVIPEFLMEIERPPEGFENLEVVDTIATRRSRMIELGDAFIALPGGTGTLEEMSEVTSLLKLGVMDAPCVLLNVNGYYEPLMAAYDAMVEHGFMPAQARNRLVAASSIRELEELLG